MKTKKYIVAHVTKNPNYYIENCGNEIDTTYTRDKLKAKRFNTVDEALRWRFTPSWAVIEIEIDQ